MKKTLVLLPVVLALIAAGCQAPGSAYYPLETGDSWTYHSVTTVIRTSQSPVSDVETTYTVRDYTTAVTGKSQLSSGTEVFVVTNTYSDTTAPQTTYLEVTGDSIYTYGSLTDSVAMNAEPTRLAVGQTWSHDYLGIHLAYTVEGMASVTVPAGSYPNCLRVVSTISTGTFEKAPVVQFRARDVGTVKMTTADTIVVPGAQSIYSSVTELQTFVQ